MELIQAGERTYYIKNPTNVGIYRLDGERVALIDSGNDKDAGKKILKLTEEQGWKVQYIINTHSHADHIGGNRVIQERTGCEIFAYGIERAFTEYPLLEPSFLYGANPFEGLKNKFLMAKETHVIDIARSGGLPGDLEFILLRGHSFDMVGVRTPDDVVFVGDSLCGAETIDKYHLFFIYNVKEYLDTLRTLSGLEGRLFIPSHAEARESLEALIELNREKIYEIAEAICGCCGGGAGFDDILAAVFTRYNLTMNTNQYVLVGSTVRSYLTWLFEQGRVQYEYADNRMIWRRQPF